MKEQFQLLHLAPSGNVPIADLSGNCRIQFVLEALFVENRHGAHFQSNFLQQQVVG